MTTSVNPLTSHQYWESLRAQGFSLPQCQACKEFHFYLRPACPACGSLDIQAVVTSGRGNVYSFSIVYRAPSPEFEKDVPYVVAIVATDEKAISRFTSELDSAVVMVNASTRFTDGSEFGFGAEIGISTQKLHARGPMGLQELTTSTYVVVGDGHTRH